MIRPGRRVVCQVLLLPRHWGNSTWIVAYFRGDCHLDYLGVRFCGPQPSLVGTVLCGDLLLFLGIPPHRRY